MKLSKIILAGLYQALGLAAYCILITFIMNGAFGFFSSGFQGPDTYYFMVFLMLFIVSALITGSIALVCPIVLAVNKNFKGAGFVILSTVIWAIIFIIIAFIVYLFVF